MHFHDAYRIAEWGSTTLVSMDVVYAAAQFTILLLDCCRLLSGMLACGARPSPCRGLILLNGVGTFCHVAHVSVPRPRGGCGQGNLAGADLYVAQALARPFRKRSLRPRQLPRRSGAALQTVQGHAYEGSCTGTPNRNPHAIELQDGEKSTLLFPLLLYDVRVDAATCVLSLIHI